MVFTTSVFSFLDLPAFLVFFLDDSLVVQRHEKIEAFLIFFPRGSCKSIPKCDPIELSLCDSIWSPFASLLASLSSLTEAPSGSRVNKWALLWRTRSRLYCDLRNQGSWDVSRSLLGKVSVVSLWDGKQYCFILQDVFDSTLILLPWSHYFSLERIN